MLLAAVLLFWFTITPDVLAGPCHPPSDLVHNGGIDDADPAARSASAQTPTPEWEDNQMKKSPDSVPRLLWD
jgi:hypothetical protein